MQAKVPLLPLLALACELTALVMVTLVLVSPAPFQHCGISLLTIVPQPQTTASTAAASSVGNASTTPSTLSALTHGNRTTTSALPSSSSVSSDNTTVSTSTANSTGRIGEAGATTTPSTTDTSAQDATNLPTVIDDTSNPTPTAANAQSSRLRRQVRIVARQAGNGTSSQSVQNATNATILAQATATPLNTNSNNGTAVPSQQAAQAQSQLRLRVGPLGSCFRSTDGSMETCSTALLHPKYDYARLLKALKAAMPASQNATNDTSSITYVRRQILVGSGSQAAATTSPISETGADGAVSALPTSMTTFPTILLLIVICVACIAGLWTVQGVVMIQAFRKGKLGGVPVFLTPLWSTIGRGTSLASLLVTVVLLIATGVSKYSLSQAKNGFNSANPVAFGMTPSSSGKTATESATLQSNSISLVADTGNGFGFIWISCVLLFAAFWLRRTWIRRQRAQALQAASIPKVDDEQAGRNASSGQTKDGPQPPISILMKQPSSKSSRGPTVLQMPPSTMTVDSYYHAYEKGADRSVRHKESLPSLYTPFAWHEDHLAKNSPPPFSTYTQQSPRYGNEYFEEHIPAHSHAPGQRMCVACGDLKDVQEQAYEPGYANEQLHAHQEQLQAAHGASAMPYRSASPAPTYWTAEDRELERQYMASMRRRREAEVQAARLAGTSSSLGHR